MAEHASSTTARIAPRDDLRLARTLPPNDPLRLRIEAASDALERLAAAIVRELDKVGVDADLEPSLGAPEAFSYAYGHDSALDVIRYLSSPDDEREIDGDFEPSLSSLNRLVQIGWAAGGDSDCEQEHDGREPQCEDEGTQCEDEGYHFHVEGF